MKTEHRFETVLTVILVVIGLAVAIVGSVQEIQEHGLPATVPFIIWALCLLGLMSGAVIYFLRQRK